MSWHVLRQPGQRLAYLEGLLDVAQVARALLGRRPRAGTSRLRSDRVEAAPPRELRDPGPQRGVVAQAVEPRVDAGEDVLEDVLGVLVAQPEAADGDRVDVPRVALDELVPRVRVAGATAADELGVGQRSSSRSPAGLEQPCRDVLRRLLARERAREPRVRTADAEVHPDEMCRCGRPARGERGGRRGVRAIRRVAVLAGQRCERGGIRAERGDLERRCGGGFELLLEREVSLRIVAAPASASRSAVSASSQTRPSVCASSTARSPIAFAWAATPAASSHLAEQRATIATSRPRTRRSARRPSLRRARARPPTGGRGGRRAGVRGSLAAQCGESTAGAATFLDLRHVPLYLTEADVASLVSPADAVEAVEACFRRMAAGEVEIAPRRRLRLPEGALADMAASDQRARARRREALRGDAERRDLRRLPLRRGVLGARRGDRGRPARAAPNRRRERRRRAATSRSAARARSA